MLLNILYLPLIYDIEKAEKNIVKLGLAPLCSWLLVSMNLTSSSMQTTIWYYWRAVGAKGGEGNHALPQI